MYVCIHLLYSLYCFTIDIIMHLLKVIANNSLGTSDPVQTDSFTYPLPPEPMLQNDNITNLTALIHLELLSTHRFLIISVEVSLYYVVVNIMNEGYLCVMYISCMY